MTLSHSSFDVWHNDAIFRINLNSEGLMNDCYVSCSRSPFALVAIKEIVQEMITS